jgi:hypothetical protein
VALQIRDQIGRRAERDKIVGGAGHDRALSVRWSSVRWSLSRWPEIRLRMVLIAVLH